MDTKLCRICGKLSENYVQIFKTEGLKNKIETCLPIIVSPHCLLPDTICSECMENVGNFYSFIKNCLQNIIVLESQYDITESCLKTKRKHEKGCLVNMNPVKFDKNIQTDEDFTEILLQRKECKVNVDAIELEKLSVALQNAEDILNGREIKEEAVKSPKVSLVSYEMETEDEFEWDNLVVSTPKMKESDNLIDEINMRKNLKRTCDTILPHRTKIFKMDTYNKRKNRRPKKVQRNDNDFPNLTFNNLEEIYKKMEKDGLGTTSDGKSLLHSCLICENQFCDSSSLVSHVYDMHGIDMAQIASSEPISERKKKIPNLVKITDLKMKSEGQDLRKDLFEEPPTLQPTFVCSLCPAVVTNRTDLFAHLKNKHPYEVSLMCGLCMQVSTTYANLTSHVTTCKEQHTVNSRFICKICSYHDDNAKVMENHVSVHEFVIEFCKEQLQMYDPSDYIEMNPNIEHKLLFCGECDHAGFLTFQEFSTHRRNEHQIFHCDLCNKFYGRNSHLWKHVNRLHKGHPNITCQLCLKTSASKYHLSQHFNKTHVQKTCKQKASEIGSESFMKQKFSGFDFQSVRQSFLRQELEERADCASDENNSDEEDSQAYGKTTDLSDDSNELVDFSSNNKSAINSQNDTKHEQSSSFTPPKEIDASSNLYTNIITNYTPPQNEGKYKCPKCYKGFHKKILLKKHKKNCRPRLQKDLLTRCKTCSRIFKDRQSLTKHLINYHSEYACEICGQKVQSKCEIVSHIRFLHPNCRLFCHCGNILRSQVDLMEHVSDHRNSFVCQFCGDMLPTKIKLKMHILSLHRKILSLSCGICLKLFETQHILRDHVRYVHKDQLLPMTSCTVCGKNYGSKWKAFDHINKSHGRIFKACKVCLEIFDTDDQLRIHFENFHANHISMSNSNKSIVGQHANSFEPIASGSIKKESESDLERNENNDKLSSSDLSNEEDISENYNNTQMEQNLSEAEELLRTKIHDNLETLTRETKISLLEKRLLGIKKLPTETNNVFNSAVHEKSVVAKPKSYSMNNQAFVYKKSKTEFLDGSHSKPSKDKKSKSHDQSNFFNMKREIDGDYDQNVSHNPLQNSSKRTVYVNSNDPSLCEICFKTWPAKKHLWQHYIRCHKTVAATVCGICLKTNDCYKSLQTHLVENHPTLLHGQGFGSNFICRICGRYHNASSKLKLHMAIHENFDWSILETTHNPDDEPPNKITNKKSTNGFPADDYLQDYTKDDKRSDINYESLIEQVECSSNSENDSDVEESNKDAREAINSSSDDESDEMLSEDDEKFIPPQNCNGEQTIPEVMKDSEPPEVSEIKLEFSSSESDDSSDSNQSLSDTEVEMMDNPAQIKSSSEDESSQFSQVSDQSDLNCKDSQSNHDAENSNIFVRKPEELDFAIRSISYEQVAVKREQIREDVCEIQSHILNPHELQSAVDSIL